MGRALEIREDLTPAELRRKARFEKNSRVAARRLAIANVFDGMDRETSARAAGMTRQILRDWIVRYNADGLAGLRDWARGHRRRALCPEQEDALKALVLRGPQDGRIRRRIVDLQAEIHDRFGVSYHERSVGKLLHRLGFTRLSVRPIHPETDLEAQEAFKKTLPPSWQLSCRSMPGPSTLKSRSRTKPGLDRKAL